MSYSVNQKKFLSNAELNELLATLERNKESDTRNVTLISMLLNTGARSNEMLALRWEDLNQQDQSVFIRGSKGSNDREIPLPEWLYKLLESLRAKHTGELVFPISRKRLYQIWDIYRPVKKGAHSMRHTFAINLYIKTKDVRLVQQALGHKSIENTLVYASYVYSVQELKKIIL